MTEDEAVEKFAEVMCYYKSIGMSWLVNEEQKKKHEKVLSAT